LEKPEFEVGGRRGRKKKMGSGLRDVLGEWTRMTKGRGAESEKLAGENDN